MERATGEAPLHDIQLERGRLGQPRSRNASSASNGSYSNSKLKQPQCIRSDSRRARPRWPTRPPGSSSVCAPGRGSNGRPGSIRGRCRPARPARPGSWDTLAMNSTDPDVEDYIRGLLARHDEPVLLEMEAEGKERGFPIVGRMVGVVLELLARSIGARRVFELGSGFGYSGYWFARALGPGGELHLTDGDPENERKARDYLGRAGLWDAVTYHVGDAVTALKDTPGEFDIVYCDIDKDGYPEAWRASRDRVRTGGLFVCDNTLWSGRVTGKVDDKRERTRPELTEAIREMNRAAAGDQGYLTTILPIRDGVLVALRLR